jgi:hypothetical protein
VFLNHRDFGFQCLLKYLPHSPLFAFIEEVVATMPRMKKDRGA